MINVLKDLHDDGKGEAKYESDALSENPGSVGLVMQRAQFLRSTHSSLYHHDHGTGPIIVRQLKKWHLRLPQTVVLAWDWPCPSDLSI